MADKNFNLKFESLPLEAQKQVLTFIDFLGQKYRGKRKTRKERAINVKRRFVGMWKDREDLRDSSSWIRNLRKKSGKNLPNNLSIIDSDILIDVGRNITATIHKLNEVRRELVAWNKLNLANGTDCWLQEQNRVEKSGSVLGGF